MSSMKNQQQELWLTKRKLEGVLDQAGVQSWDWDINSNRLVLSRSELMDRIFAGLSRFEDDMLVVDGFDPETMEFRFVPPDYQQAFRDSFRGLRAVEAGELGDASCALIMLDLDSFKLANDVFGHAYGDQVIVHVAEALKESFPGDVVCRMGGDEFLVWCEDVDEGALEDRIASALRAMEVERVEDGRTFLFSASAGYVLVPQEGFSFDDLYQKADSALFSVKMDGKRSCSRFWSGMKTVRCELAE